MSLTVTLDIHLQADAVATAPVMMREILTQTRAFEGCLGVEVLVDQDDPAHVIFIERWESLEADAAYRVWRAGDGATELGTIIDRAPVLLRFDTATDI